MTGTAATEAEEFMEIYKLGVVEIPTNRPIARLDEDDKVYRTTQENMMPLSQRSKRQTQKVSQSWLAQHQLKNRNCYPNN